MREAVICEPLRTLVGRYSGALRTVTAATLAATVIQALTERASVDPAAIDDVIFGQCYPNGEAPEIGRGRLDADLHQPDTPVDRVRCQRTFSPVPDVREGVRRPGCYPNYTHRVGPGDRVPVGTRKAGK